MDLQSLDMIYCSERVFNGGFLHLPPSQFAIKKSLRPPLSSRSSADLVIVFAAGLVPLDIMVHGFAVMGCWLVSEKVD